ncbi:YopX family protein [Clostridium sp. MT-14]|uniref:YopX family protein n=1 Tax=Clostridium sp. MT-14 TaxID=3348360 RepID=UPI0035F4F427
MRECKFRGRAICDYEQFGIIGIKKNTWVYGYYYKDVEEIDDEQSFEYVSYIRMPYGDHYVDIEIIPETVGEYTGLRDKNGREIYEGDICKELYEDGMETGEILQIIWSGYYKFDAKVIKGGVLTEGLNFPLWHWDKREENGYRQLEVIGNIYENPEILKEGE